MSRERFLLLLDAAEYLAAHIHEAPVWIVPCLEGGNPTRISGSSIYPAFQNILLAARALRSRPDIDHTVSGFREGRRGRTRPAARRIFKSPAADPRPTGGGWDSPPARAP